MLTICKPTRAKERRTRHRPDGLGTLYHTRHLKKRPQSFWVLGAEYMRLNNDLLYPHATSMKRGEHSAGSYLKTKQSSPKTATKPTITTTEDQTLYLRTSCLAKRSSTVERFSWDSGSSIEGSYSLPLRLRWSTCRLF
jgi:hypothetical protein